MARALSMEQKADAVSEPGFLAESLFRSLPVLGQSIANGRRMTA